MNTPTRQQLGLAAKGFFVWLALGIGTAQAQILIGQTAGFSGAVAAGVKETTDGAALYFNAINAKGGVNGQKIELISLDDKFEPPLAAENARKLITERNVLALFLSRGTPHTEAILPLLTQYGVPLVAPSTGSAVLHEPVKKYIFNVRAPYQRESEKAVLHLKTLGLQRIAVVHPDDSFGRDGLEGANKGFKKIELDPITVIKTDRAKPDYNQIVPQLIGYKAQAVLWIGSASVVAEGVRVLRAAGSAAQVVTLSNNASSGFIKALGPNSQGVIVTQVFPNERSIAYPMVKEAQALAKAQGQSGVSPAMLEGFAGAKVLVEALSRAGKNPSRESLQSALEGMKFFDLGGLQISFSESDHSGLDFADLSIIGSDGKFKR
jgi:branched-chain amino acid transport system substrate-binding protein